MDEERFRELVGRTYDRSFHPPGVARQLHAVNCSGNRTRALRAVDLPALVIHGAADPLVRPACGRETARAIPGARLSMIEGMGHDLPPELHRRFVDEIDANARRARACS
jgi:proline iminopeptidase